MKSIKHRLLSLLLTLVTVLSLLPTAAFAASNTGSGLKITSNQAYWSTRLLANGTPYSYRPPLVDGKLVYCIVDENGNFRTMPTLSDWYEILYQEQDTRHLAVVLSRYVTGSAAAMAGRNDIELNNKYIVLDLSGMPDDMIADGTFWATSIAYDLIMNCEDELSALLADELWSLVGATANPQAAGFVLEMVKTIRGLGGIAVTSTQGMRAAKMKERPTFQLMCQTDVQSIYHMQMPRWLFSDPRYCEMSLDAKVTYTFLLNRFQLSRKNGWVNDRGEVFVIFPRKALAKELRICEQRVTAAFKKLVELKLVWEKRCGRGDANQIYLARVTPIEDPDYSCAPFITEDESEVRGSRTSDLEGLADGKPSAACQEPQNLLSKNREDRASRTAKSAFPEPQKLTPSKKEKRKIDQSHMEVRPSVRAPAQDGRTDGDAEEELLDILDGCELECFAPETALVFENAIERLFYADSFRIGNATLPQSRVRAKLRRLDGMILREAESKLRANQERNVKNSTAYTMAVLFNCIAESESDLMIDPYLNAICAAV